LLFSCLRKREFTKNSAISKDLFVIIDFKEIIVPFVK